MNMVKICIIYAVHRQLAFVVNFVNEIIFSRNMKVD